MKLIDHPFIKSVSESRRDAVMSEVEILDLKQGEILFEENSEPDALYAILEGIISFTKHKPDGNHQDIGQCGEGTFFGEVGVFTGERRALDASAMTDCIVARVPEHTVKKIIEDVEPVKRILESVISHLKTTTRHYVDEVMRTEKRALVGTMISSILHDFKNPFSIISLGSHIIGQRYAEDPKTVQICNNIEAQIRRMVDMANDLAAFGRGEEQIEVAPVSLDKLFAYFKELNEPFFTDNEISVELHANDVNLQGDSGKLIRVLQNLVNNAIESIKQSKQSGKVIVEASETDDSVIITVEDSGPGIPEKIRDTFFEPFVTYGKVDGTGLGSAIVRSIVQAHSGTVDFETSENGTTFKIVIPKILPEEQK